MQPFSFESMMRHEIEMDLLPVLMLLISDVNWVTCKMRLLISCLGQKVEDTVAIKGLCVCVCVFQTTAHQHAHTESVMASHEESLQH